MHTQQEKTRVIEWGGASPPRRDRPELAKQGPQDN